MVMLFALVTIVSFSQTRVRSYYRKDGTYVSGYSRGGSSSSGYSYTSEYSDDKKGTKSNNNGVIRVGRSSYNQIEFSPSNLVVTDSGFVILVSVIRYNDKPISVVTPSKEYSSLDYDDISRHIYHKINSNEISQENVLELVSKYGWTLYDGILKYDTYSLGSGFPSYIKHSFEYIKVK